MKGSSCLTRVSRLCHVCEACTALPEPSYRRSDHLRTGWSVTWGGPVSQREVFSDLALGQPTAWSCVKWEAGVQVLVSAGRPGRIQEEGPATEPAGSSLSNFTVHLRSPLRGFVSAWPSRIRFGSRVERRRCAARAVCLCLGL